MMQILMQILLEESKREILEKEELKGWKREKSEFNLFGEWNIKYSKFYAQLTSGKLIIPKIKKKIVDFRFNIVTNVEALRFILEKELDLFKIKKIWYRTDFKKANSLYFPYLYEVGEFKGEWLKVDIKRCFYEIYSKLGIDVSCVADINEEVIKIKGIGRGLITKENSELIMLLESEKTLRNSVYGLTRCCFLTVLYPNSRPQRQYFRSRIQNLDLTVVISAFLHDFVSKFRNQILYWNIDGGIIKPEAYEQMKKYLEELGFTLKKEAEGEAIILGLGSYKVGDFETEHFRHGVMSNLQKKEYLYKVMGIEKILKWFRKVKNG
ncbi:MAG: hypothetical protein QXS69_02665 [Candidatus Aenigmatarchaeota archaeon]